MAFQRKAIVSGDFMLSLFNLRIIELRHATTMRTDQMIMMITIIQLENRLSPIELTSRKDPGLFKLRQYTINSRQTDIDVFSDQ
jgi:hypothetical protein